MKTCMTLLISLVLLGASAALANRQEPSDTHTFILHFPQTIDTSSLSIYYFLTGSFGGYGGFVRTQPNTWDYAVETSYDDKPAKTLKAIIFCPGYEMKLINVPSLDDLSVKDAVVEFTRLGSIRLSGKVVLPQPRSGGSLMIEATYLAHWGHEFFGISDGFVSSFTIGSSTLSEDGSFSMLVPDFAHDSSSSLFKHHGAISLTARATKTGNVLYWLERPGASRGSNTDPDIQIAEEYGELILNARPNR